MPLNIQELMEDTRVEVVTFQMAFLHVSPDIRELEQDLPPSPFLTSWTLQIPTHHRPKQENQGGRQPPLKSLQHLDFHRRLDIVISEYLYSFSIAG